MPSSKMSESLAESMRHMHNIESINHNLVCTHEIMKVDSFQHNYYPEN